MLSALIGVLIATIACATLFGRLVRDRTIPDARWRQGPRSLAAISAGRSGRPFRVAGTGGPGGGMWIERRAGLSLAPVVAPPSTGESADTDKFLSDHLGSAMRAGSPS